MKELVWFSSWSCTDNIMYFLPMSQPSIHSHTLLESRVGAHPCWALLILRWVGTVVCYLKRLNMVV